ncbi:MAG: hypothetical protein M5U28_49635 [Sandaracinaceae bacterium]|nr:hypothetical protein [Sandaracinaceae bacterium]
MEDAGRPAGEPDAFVPEPASVRITAPADGATFVQTTLVGGEWAARVAFTLEASGVDRVELFADGTYSLGVADTSGALSYDFLGEGERAISAVGLSAAGEELARDEIVIHVEPPADTSCHAMLDALGLDWSPASATRGIADPVRVQPYIDGVRFRYVSNAEPTAMLMDCELGVRLHALARLVAGYGIDEVIHIGDLQLPLHRRRRPGQRHLHAEPARLRARHRSARLRPRGRRRDAEHRDRLRDHHERRPVPHRVLRREGPRPEGDRVRALVRAHLPDRPHAELQRGAPQPLPRRSHRGLDVHRRLRRRRRPGGARPRALRGCPRLAEEGRNGRKSLLVSWVP